jgi:hypothetical protein
MENFKPVEAVKDVYHTAQAIGEFVVKRALPGAWAELANIVKGEQDV